MKELTEEMDIKALLLKLSQALESHTPIAHTNSEQHSPPHREENRLVVKNPWSGDRYSWGEAISSDSFRIPYTCISTEYQKLSHAGRSLRLITLFLAYGPHGQNGIIELKKSNIRETYNFDTRTLERAIYELRESGLLVEIGREGNQRNKPMRYFVMVPVGCFGTKAAIFENLIAQTPSIHPPSVTAIPISPSSTPTSPQKFPTPFEYKEAKDIVQKFYELIPHNVLDPGKLLGETLLSSEMIRFYGKDRVLNAISHLPKYPPFLTTKPKSFRWFSSCINSILESLEKETTPPPKSTLPSLVPPEENTDEFQKKKLHWIRLSETEQLQIKDKVLDLYPFIKNEAVLETIAMEMAYQQRDDLRNKVGLSQ